MTDLIYTSGFLKLVIAYYFLKTEFAQKLGAEVLIKSKDNADF